MIEFREDGSITIAGHRVRLSHVIRVLEASTSWTEACEALPTIDPTLLRRVVEYRDRHESLIQQYMAREDELAASNHAESSRGPTLAELRRRAGA